MSNSISDSGKMPFRHEDFKKAKANPNQPQKGDEGEKMKFVKEKLKHKVIDDYKPKAPINAARGIDKNDYKPNAALLNIRPGPSELNLPFAESSKKPQTNSTRALPTSSSRILPEDKAEEVITKKTHSNKPRMPHVEELKESEVLKRRKDITDAGEQDPNKR